MMLLSHNHAHFNPAHAGATVALDARFLTGLADGDSVGTWTGRGATSPTASGSDRPTYKTAIVSGQPVVRFSGSNILSASNPNVGVSSCSVVAVFSTSSYPESAATVVDWSKRAIGGRGFWVENTGKLWFWPMDNNDVKASSATVSSTPAIQTYIANGAMAFGSNGVMQTAVSYSDGANDFTGSTTIRVGRDLLEGLYGSFGFAGDIAALAVIPSAISAAVRKRIEQSLAFSFRIACA